MLDVIGWLIFLAALLISVMLHETGHFVTAKRFGMKCTQYFIGFGPTIWSTQRGETEYGIKALPLGGFVKITGMTSIDEVDEEDEPRSFRRAPGWQRLIVLGAGSFMHFVLAAVIIFGLALGIGIENQITTNQVAAVTPCVQPSKAALLNGAACKPDAPKSAAVLAGLKVGDTVTAFNGVKMTSWTQLHNAILAEKPGEPVSLTVDRDGRSMVLHTRLAEVPGYGTDLGFDATVNTVFQQVGPLGAIRYVGSGFSEVVTGSVSSLAKLPGGRAGSVQQGKAGDVRRGQRVERLRRGQGHRPGGRRRRGLEAEGLLHPAAHRVAEHLRRDIQPAAAAADGRRPRRGGAVGDGAVVVRPATAPARSRAGRLP